MTALPLQLRFCADPLPVTAGWVPDADVTLWLNEARRIMEAHPLSEVKFHPLALSPRDPIVAGAILTISPVPPALDKIFSPRVQRLGEAAPGVLVPILSRLDPALTPEESRRLFPWALHFLHPVLGLTGFDVTDALTPSLLLILPPVEHDGWFAAVPGPPEPPALKQLTLSQEISLEELMNGAGGDIATQRPDKLDKPRLPGTGLIGGAAGIIGGIGSAIAGIGAGLGSGLLRKLGAGGVADKIGQWSDRFLRDVSDRRQRELDRLLDRFDKDLLDALRHAIPLTGAESRRGAAATPGWQLGARSMDLNSRSHGSGPVDVWNINYDMRLKLERRYREAATREAAAGHFARAAYIYGELLGDWNMAAQMLEKAGRTREAARIYMERLRSGPRAAACLEKAGLLAEAAALYRDAGMHEKAGDLFAQLGNEEAAREQWHLALKSLTSPLDQAKLLETKLGDVDRALFILDRAWPGTPQALACFQEEFALLARHGRHAEAAEILARIERNPAARLYSVFATVTGLRTVFTTYPDSEVATRASYLAIQFSGEFLAREPAGSTAKQLLSLLPDFAPGDRILRRDTNRFSIGANKPDVPLLRRNQKTLRPSRVVELQKDVAWESLASNARTLSIAGWWHLGLGTPLAFRSIFGEGPQPGTQHWKGIPEKRTRMHHVLRDPKTSVAYHFKEFHTATWVDNQVSDTHDSVLALGSLEGRSEFLLLCYTSTASVAVKVMGFDGTLLRTRVLDLAPPEIKDSEWFVGGHGEDIWIAGPSVACCVNEKVQFQLAQLNGPVTSFAVAPPVLSSQAIAVCLGEAVLLIPPGKGKPLESVNLYAGSDLVHPPLVTFTRDGRAIIAEAAGGVVYALRKSCEKVSDIVIPPNSGHLISAAPWNTTGFAFLTSTGKVLLYEG